MESDKFELYDESGTEEYFIGILHLRKEHPYVLALLKSVGITHYLCD